MSLPFHSHNHKPKFPMALSSRRLLLHYTITTPNSAASESSPTSTTFDTNLIMILAVLLTALICALGLNAIVSCIFRLSGRSRPSFPIVLPGTAARRRAIRKVPVEFFSPGLKLASSGLECAICLAEIEPGDRIRLLSVCGHGFHVRCIDRWLLTRPTCPRCRQCPFATSPKSSGCVESDEVDRTGIEPLGPEGLEIARREEERKRRGEGRNSSSTTAGSAAGESSPSSTTFDANVIMILAFLLAALICALSLNVIISCIFRLFGRSSQSFPIVRPGAAARRRAIRKVPVEFFSPGLKLAGSDSECAICLAEIEPGDRIRLLPVCRHGFHVRCIDQWLLTRPTCPRCRQCPFVTTNPKSSGCVEPEEVDRTGIEPLGPEELEGVRKALIFIILAYSSLDTNFEMDNQKDIDRK
ncbi:hypothetical protein M5K25_020671 [Dendrobium thyrsiflorum]|uniref:RING-type domain-containing protein n=1 Tax=Dendrobium thyrsiflorum TaxID=117978 RepID=A0ABD0UAJ0_DENTH